MSPILQMRKWIRREADHAQVRSVELGAGPRPSNPMAPVLGLLLNLRGVAVVPTKPYGRITCHRSDTQQTLDMLILLTFLNI